MATASSFRTRALVDKVLRTDHATALATKYIYKGQLAVFNNRSIRRTIQESLSQEQLNISKLEGLIPLYRARPSLLMPLCKTAGFIFGAMTALYGKEVALRCKSAIEIVVGEQYNDQIRELFADDPVANVQLLEILKQLRDRDLDKHDLFFTDHQNSTPFHQRLDKFLRFVTMVGLKAVEKV